MAVGEGTLLDDRYRLGSVIGLGGTSEVRDGRDQLLERPVAVKLLRKENLGDPHLAQTFEREARTAGRLANPHVVKIFDVGESGGHPYLVMERLTGESLAHRLLAGPLDGEGVRRLADDLLGALAAAHAGGILHQDIKPSKILFAADGSVKIADFGVPQGTKHLSSSLSEEPSETNIIAGTPAYLAPERFEGFPATRRSDLWSVGVVLYEALLGVKPFVGESPQAVRYAVTHHRPVRLDWLRPELEPALPAAVHQALEKRPEERFASATEMGAAIGTSLVWSSRPTSERRAGGSGVETAVITEATAPVGQERDRQRVASAFVAQLVVLRKIRPRSARRAPLLGAALVVLALTALCGALAVGPLTTSTGRRTAVSSPATSPTKTPPAATPTTSVATTPISPVGTPSAPPSPAPPSPAVIPAPVTHAPITPAPVTPAPVPSSANAPGKADHQSDNGGGKSHGGGHG